jgi:hypothetical protein
MPTVNLQPTQQDNQVTLLKKFLQAVNLYWGGALPSQPVNVDVTVNEEGDTIIVPAVPTVSTVEVSSGNVGGFSYLSYQARIGNSGVYTAGDVIGPVPTNITPFRASKGKFSSILQSVTLTDRNQVGPDIRILLGLPGAFAAVADNGGLDVTDISLILQVVDIAAADWVAAGTGGKVVSLGGIGKVLAVPPSFDTVYMAVYTPTGFTATVNNGITVQLGFLQD